MQNWRTVRLAMLLALGVLASQPLAAAPHVTFVRRIPAVHDLGEVHRVVFIYALGDSDRLRGFVDTFSGLLGRDDDFSVEDITERSQNLGNARPDDPLFIALRRHHRADVYLGVTQFTCSSDEKSSKGTERTESGREPVVRHWIEARCSTRIDVMDGVTARRLFSFPVSGDGTTVPSSTRSADDGGHALDEAARHAAIAAVESLAPRRLRESIELDSSAPGFDEAYSWIDAGQLDRAREVFEKALRDAPNAAVHYDLAAVCEANGDAACAKTNYERALALSPKEERFAAELRRFRRRASEGNVRR